MELLKYLNPLLVLSVRTHQLSPCWDNLKVSHRGGKPLGNEIWKSEGIERLVDLTGPHDRKLLTFGQDKDEYSLQDKDFLVYMQIRAQLTDYCGQTVIIPQPN